MYIYLCVQLGADLIVVLDECTPFNVDKQYTAHSTRRSHRWALRSLVIIAKTPRSLTNRFLGRVQAYSVRQASVVRHYSGRSV